MRTQTGKPMSVYAREASGTKVPGYHFALQWEALLVPPCADSPSIASNSEPTRASTKSLSELYMQTKHGFHGYSIKVSRPSGQPENPAPVRGKERQFRFD